MSKGTIVGISAGIIAAIAYKSVTEVTKKVYSTGYHDGSIGKKHYFEEKEDSKKKVFTGIKNFITEYYC